MVKSSPASSLVMVEPQLVFQLLKIAFDTPAYLRQPDQILEWHVLWDGGEPIARGLLFAGRPFNKQPFGLSARARYRDGPHRPAPGQTANASFPSSLPASIPSSKPCAAAPERARAPRPAVAPRFGEHLCRLSQALARAAVKRLLPSNPQARIGQDPHRVGKTSLGQSLSKLCRRPYPASATTGARGTSSDSNSSIWPSAIVPFRLELHVLGTPATRHAAGPEPTLPEDTGGTHRHAQQRVDQGHA